MAMSTEHDPNEAAMPPLPEDASPTARDFHAYCVAELERRRARDVAFDADRFHKAVEMVMHRLAGTDGGAL